MASHERTSDRGEVVKENIETLRTLGVTQLRPMLLAAFVKFKPGQFAKLLEKSVSWSVRFLVGSTPSGTIEGYYAKIAMEIWNGKIDKADEATTIIQPILPSDDEFRVAFENAAESKEKIARYYLRALQKTVDGTAPEKDLTLEHILPKKLDNHWTHIGPEEHPLYLHRIGNFALLKSDDNGRIQGKPYSFKKTVLDSSSSPSLTRAAGKFAKWGIQEIEARQKQLAEIAAKTWPVK